MRRLNPDYVERVRQLVEDSPFFSLLSTKVRELSAGHAIFEIEAEKKHHQPFGVVHGGVLASIVDGAAFWSIICEIEDENTGITSVDLKLNYLAPVTAGKIVATGRRIKMGKTLAYAEASVLGPRGELLAHGTSTVMLLPGRRLPAKPPLPPKFIEDDSGLRRPR
jgi:uncharacterized protein (TIGR00369 family)